IRDGMSRQAAACIGGMDRQTLRDWVHAFNKRGLEGLVNDTSPGRPCKLSAKQKAALKAVVEEGPDPERDGVVRWRCSDLVRFVEMRFGVSVSEDTIGRTLRALDFSHITARPKHPQQKKGAIAHFKKVQNKLQSPLKATPQRVPINIWSQDKMPIGQKNGCVRQWPKRGTRPRQPVDQRYESAYVFGAICPARDTGVALVLPQANTWA